MFNIDFSQCKESAGSYGGAGGKKKGIIYNGENYMLKFSQDVREQKIGFSYSNSSINEYIACHIFQSLGIQTQETLLGTYNDKIVVACKDFTNNGYISKNNANDDEVIADFAGFDGDNTSALNSIRNEMLGSATQQADKQKPSVDGDIDTNTGPKYPKR